jgi:DNA-binding transcriptional ArsR family regulator
MKNDPAALVDDRFAALADASRRRVLRLLARRAEGGDDPSATVSELASVLAEGTVDTAPSESVVAAETRLHHAALPGLERADLVERANERVHLRTDPDVVWRALDLAERFDDAEA